MLLHSEIRMTLNEGNNENFKNTGEKMKKNHLKISPYYTLESLKNLHQCIKRRSHELQLT